MVTVLIEQQKNKLLVWCGHELIGEFNAKYTYPSGKPFEIARVAQLALKSQNIESRIDIEEPLVDFRKG